jgi:hypothetical protein
VRRICLQWVVPVRAGTASWRRCSVSAAHEADVIHIDVACEHSHGTGGAKRACAYVARVYSGAMEIETHDSALCVSDVLRFDCRATGGCIVGRDGNVLA